MRETTHVAVRLSSTVHLRLEILYFKGVRAGSRKCSPRKWDLDIQPRMSNPVDHEHCRRLDHGHCRRKELISTACRGTAMVGTAATCQLLNLYHLKS